MYLSYGEVDAHIRSEAANFGENGLQCFFFLRKLVFANWLPDPLGRTAVMGLSLRQKRQPSKYRELYAGERYSKYIWNMVGASEPALCPLCTIYPSLTIISFVRLFPQMLVCIPPSLAVRPKTVRAIWQQQFSVPRPPRRQPHDHTLTTDE